VQLGIRWGDDERLWMDRERLWVIGWFLDPQCGHVGGVVHSLSTYVCDESDENTRGL